MPRGQAMDEVVVYFDVSGNSGPLGKADQYAELGAWLDLQDAKQFPALLHLWEHGWYDNLASLAREINRAKEKIPSVNKGARAALVELLDLIESAAADDSAVALTVT